MSKGYLDLVRYPSGKEIRVRADFVALINETKNGAMYVLLDGGQVFVSTPYSIAQRQHEDAANELAALQTIYIAPSPMQPASGTPQTGNTPETGTANEWEKDDEIPF